MTASMDHIQVMVDTASATEWLAVMNKAGWDFTGSPCGSRVTCNPPPLNTDEDWLIFWDEATGKEEVVSNLMQWLEDEDWEWDGNSDHYQQVLDEGFLLFVCQRMNVMDKDHRVMIFQAVLYGTCMDRKAERGDTAPPDDKEIPF